MERRKREQGWNAPNAGPAADRSTIRRKSKEEVEDVMPAPTIGVGKINEKRRVNECLFGSQEPKVMRLHQMSSNFLPAKKLPPT